MIRACNLIVSCDHYWPGNPGNFKKENKMKFQVEYSENGKNLIADFKTIEEAEEFLALCEDTEARIVLI
jgi:hypothetical protein